MDTIKFANGEIHSCPHLVPNPDMQMLFVALDDVSFAEASAIFSDENKTKEMEWGAYRFIGYSELLYVKREDYGYKACLKGGYYEQK